MRQTAKTTAAVSAVLLCAGLATGARAVIEWDLSHAWPDGDFHVENVETFA